MTFSRNSDTRQVVENVGHCRAKSIPIGVWHIHKSVAAGPRQQVRQTLCIAIVSSEQNSDRWISTRRKRNEVIIRGEPHWNQKLCLGSQLKRQKTRTTQVFGRPNGLAESQNRICREKSPFQVQMRHLTLQSSRLHHQVRFIPSVASSIGGVKRIR